MQVAAMQMPEVRDDLRRAQSLVKHSPLDAQQGGADRVCFPECYLQGYDVRARHVAAAALDLESSQLAEVLGEIEAVEPVVVVGLVERDAGVFAPGASSPVFEVAGVRVGINICYDPCFAESVAGVAARGAERQVCPCGNMLPRDVAEEWKPRHNEIRTRRAQDHGMWVVSSDITGERDGLVSYGPTAVVDAHGTIVDQVPLMRAGTATARIR